jgi:hypothetical protein
MPTPNPKPPAPGLVPIEAMVGDDDEDTTLLRKMASDAESFLRSHRWCPEARVAYFGGGVGGIFAVFLCQVKSPSPDVGPWLWAIVGDIPSAYLPLEDAPSPSTVFRSYMDGMTRWVEFARKGKIGGAEDGVPPLTIPSTPQWADKIQGRLNTLALIIQPLFDGSGGDETVQ